MNARPLSVSTVFVLILLNSFIWLAFGIVVVSGLHPALPNQPLIKTVMASLAFAIAAVLFALFYFLASRHRAAYFLTIGLLVAVYFATIFDDFGLVDFLVLVINITPIVLLIKDRAWYLQKKSGRFDRQEAA